MRMLERFQTRRGFQPSLGPAGNICVSRCEGLNGREFEGLSKPWWLNFSTPYAHTVLRTAGVRVCQPAVVMQGETASDERWAFVMTKASIYMCLSLHSVQCASYLRARYQFKVFNRLLYGYRR